MISEPDLRQILSHLGLDPEESALRAKFLMEDLDWIQFEDFTVHRQTCYLPNDPDTPVLLAEYSFGPTKLNINNVDRSTDKRCTSVGGTGLNSGSRTPKKIPTLGVGSSIHTIPRRKNPAMHHNAAAMLPALECVLK